MQVIPRLYVAGYKYRVTPQHPWEPFVLVDLSNTSVSAGWPYVDHDDKRGFFTDRVDVRIWFEDEPRLIVRKAGPGSSSEGGSSSTSMSYTVNGGFFGETGTGGVSYSISSGSSQTLPDFEILQQVGVTRGTALEQTYRLKTIGGATYYHPIDAVSLQGSGSIHPLNAKAISDLPIVSSVMFHSPEWIGGTRKLKIQIAHRAVFVEKTFEPILRILGIKTNPYNVDRDNEPQTCRLFCTMGIVKIDTRPALNNNEWTIDVDLQNGGASFNG